ncbi:hypothetical protein [Acinetobacter haemolyticus]|uniref:hypothetical protein n=1 Tax=Acinetobacter haemolyticus TaxID=29430 RepID=UPI0013723368|nr:hypothetical protein [Acinetobacter haemolyticus]NAR91473.1 hypothetical protein [Acinetobacter haemolyticus]
MKNYKIKVNGPDNSAEIQDLFFELGYVWVCSKKDITNLDATYIYAKDGVLTAGFNDLNFAEAGHQELTLPQLRDLVVLHRNDVQDANWVTEGDDQIYQDSNGKSFIFREQGWDELQRHEMRQAMWEKIKPKPQHAEVEQGLISGADALRALADGKEVEYLYGADNWLSVIEMQVMITAFTGSKFKFRLKPRTTKLSLEIPAPFEPKLGETYYFITTSNSQGFDFTEFDDSDGDKLYMQLGAYRSASDASKVFEALRGGIKG